jgi:aspartokinase-like uncharacterized kinase
MTRPAWAGAFPLAQVRVVKLGGSLLEWPGLVARLQSWLAAQPPSVNVLIVGGGALVDKLRELDAAHNLPAAASHLLAIRAMTVTAALVAELVPRARLFEAIEQLDRSELDAPQILDVRRFLSQDRASGDPLPASWDVTSDSIAARVATALDAHELVLLKSALPAGPANFEALARSGYVDAYFPRAAQTSRIRCVNLRCPNFSQVVTG